MGDTTRRSFLRTFGIGATGMVGPRVAWAAARSKRPNTLLFLVDDQRKDTLGCAGHPIVKNPRDRRPGGPGRSVHERVCDDLDLRGQWGLGFDRSSRTDPSIHVRHGASPAGALPNQLSDGASVDGQALREASWSDELAPGEFCFNRASARFLVRRPDQSPVPSEGLRWRRMEADDKGFFHFGEAGGNAVFRASAWVWVPPRARAGGRVWDPRFPEPISGKLTCGGEFRAFRMTGSGLEAQVNKYRLWVNGELLPSAYVPGRPRAHHNNYGFQDRWDGFVLKEGWCASTIG